MWIWLLACGGSDSRLDEALDRIEALEGRLGELEARLDAHQATLDAHQATLDGQEVALDAQSSEIDAQRATLEAQGAELDALELGGGTSCDLREATGTCWSDPTCVALGACSVRRVFVTSRDYGANFGEGDPLRVADNRCQALAAGAGLGGDWRAWLALGGDAWSAPARRFAPYDGPYERLDGVRVADDRADLLDGTLAAGIDLDELGQVQTGTAWSGVGADGASVPISLEDTCNDWAFDGWGYGYGPTYASQRGVIGATDATWTADVASPCRDDARLYCFEQ